MNHRHFHLVAAITAALLAAGSSASAQTAATESAAHPLGQHPAILVQRQTPQIDTNRFIPMHPAGLFVIATPTPTYDHPAVAVARMSRQASAAELQRNIEQPPIAIAWLRRSEQVAAGAAAAAANH
jgi:hypothetical protein